MTRLEAVRQGHSPMLIVLLRPSEGLVGFTHSGEGILLYSVYQFKHYAHPEATSQTRPEQDLTKYLGTRQPRVKLIILLFNFAAGPLPAPKRTSPDQATVLTPLAFLCMFPSLEPSSFPPLPLELLLIHHGPVRGRLS